MEQTVRSVSFLPLGTWLLLVAGSLPTLLMAPLLILAYIGLARREDRELGTRFGEAFGAYAARTPPFLPSRRRFRAKAPVW